MNPKAKRLLIPIAIILVLAIGGTVTASKLEEQDSFCISCHLAPEVTYHDRSLMAGGLEDPFDLPDLASYHYWQDTEFRCIDCHRGDDTIGHRAAVLILAAGDTITWATGEPDETLEKSNIINVDPNTTEWEGAERYSKRPDILNAGCLKCHQDTLTLIGFDNHFHNKLPSALEAYAQTGELNYPEDWPEGVGSSDLLQAEETILTCLDCHRAHAPGFESAYFLDQDFIVFPACVQCHVETGHGPVDLIR